MPRLVYYQFGGFRPQIECSYSTSYDEKELCSIIAGPSSPLRSNGNPDGPVEVILGIKEHGSSHLLLTDEQRKAFGSSLRPGRSQTKTFFAHDFESLSPIYFHTTKELGDKLSSLRPKANKNKPAKDTSQANKGYLPGDSDLYRGAFEHGRVIYRIFNNAIDALKFGVDNTLWAPHLRISAFVFNTKGVDHRSSEERLKDPVVLDVGYCGALIPSLQADYTSAKHIIHIGNSVMGGGRPKKPFNHGNSEKVSATAMPAHIQDIFREFQQSTENPMILLVYNRQLTKNFLQKMGVNTQTWCLGLKDLIMPKSYARQSPAQSPNRHSSNQYTHGRGRSSDNNILSYGSPDLDRNGMKRSRSRSPRMDGRNNTYQNPYPASPSMQSNRGKNYRDRRTPSPPAAQARRRYSPVFVLDIQQLYQKLTGNDQVKDVVDIAQNLGLTNVDGMCAGNEAGLMIDIWKSMVSGPPIDEQRKVIGEQQKLRAEGGGQGVHATPGAGPSNSAPLVVDSDDEQDPNDVVAQPHNAQPASAGQDPYNFNESDHESASESD
ncbi:hypothetical protein GALMADRAFT_252303 [Galerina marginata CBS 339.88]|uniref:Uncharacterized protein n=1 Tax=Galerina marginata (strain CBS 339.88) TaxID=685588 RepID=A0A067SPV7_GALM3|nr:hypothetical protein GALMADRAFT_252303 [Galerina marginata CBS 339.88]